MNIKNYTSSVPVERTVARIESILAQAGATDISKNYCGGELMSLCFKFTLPASRSVTVRLPVNHAAVRNLLLKTVKRPRRGTLEKMNEQALRTSWKLMQDWVEVQLTLIRMQQVDFLQVFMPYVWDGQRTVYEVLKAGSYKALLGAPEPAEV